MWPKKLHEWIIELRLAEGLLVTPKHLSRKGLLGTHRSSKPLPQGDTAVVLAYPSLTSYYWYIEKK
jgi:hypothetical protein